MNRAPNEKLSDFFADMDSDLLDAAMSADTPEKLAQYKKAKYNTLPVYKRPAFLRVAAAAACFALLVNIVFYFKNNAESPEADVQINRPFENQEKVGEDNGSSGSVVETPPGIDATEEEFTIKSVDMLNYYSAVMLLAQQSHATPTASTGDTDYQVQMLNNTQPNTQPPNIMPPPPPQWPDETEPYPGNTEGPPVQPPTETNPPVNPEEEIIYYAFSPEEIFYVSKVYFFQMELTGEGFLANKIGTGIVDVVITNAIWDEYLITFKNGDNYYSCLTNGGSPMSLMVFSTHKYIDGYNVVKRFREDNTYFTVSFGMGGQVDQLEEGIYEREIFRILGETYIAEVEASFTIDQLETYFRNAADTASV